MQIDYFLLFQLNLFTAKTMTKKMLQKQFYLRSNRAMEQKNVSQLNDIIGLSGPLDNRVLK